MAQLGSVSPVWAVRDIAPMRDALVEQFGFHVQGEAGDPPVWTSVMRDVVEIMLIAGDHPQPAQDWAAYVFVDDVDALYEEALGRGAEICGPPADKPYNCREFAARLPDGRLIAFAGTM